MRTLNAGLGAADRSCQVHLAAPRTVAQAVRSTRRLAQVFAAVARIRGTAATLTHWPGEPGRLQLRQSPVQALSQQTPSTHWLDSQSLGSVQYTPGFFFPQLPVVAPCKEVATHW
jgi:hypothetical protein